MPAKPVNDPAPPATTDAAIAAANDFITRWRGVTASELSTSQSFIADLCDLLAVPRPTHEPHYMYERPITFQHGDGNTSAGRVDCYLRGHFVWESKKLNRSPAGVAAQARGGRTTKAFDDALMKARNQAEEYARALPASEGRPPFVVVADVGHVIELYAEFTRSGGTYTPFPDPGSHRIRLEQLADPAIRARLSALWTDPLSLDPSRVSAKATRAVAIELAGLARAFEADGHPAQTVAAFLIRCLFSMFAEDVGLLPHVTHGEEGGFTHLLRRHREKPDTLLHMLKLLWKDMDEGAFSPVVEAQLLRFNGKLFKGAGAQGYVLPMNTAQIDGLLRAASANWKEVEPAIFGTLLERALDPTERHALGAHYTPRAYVERLVLPTVVEPLRADWANAQAAALLLARQAQELEANPPQLQGGTAHATYDPVLRAKDKKTLADHDSAVRQAWAAAQREIRLFHHRLCTTRVLDPACGSGNFLYVTLEHLKRLEAEVLNQLREFGPMSEVLPEGETVTLRQLLGIEINGRAAAVAELVLWIGWLQWQVRTQGLSGVSEPVVHDYGNIEHRDAVLAYDRVEPALDAEGKVITRWDGVSFKKHPVTGEDVPDETAQLPQWRYVNPRQAEWPQVEFIVGNPPFIGNKRMRGALGSGYVDALRGAWTDVPDTSDFVMFWWEKAAELTRLGSTRRFGFITTNSLKQVFNRKVVDRKLAAKPPLHLHFAIADHPWVDSADGAAVRIAMSVGAKEDIPGTALRIVDEQPQGDGESAVTLVMTHGLIHSDLVVGANVAAARKLEANSRICFQGFVLVGEGFVVSDEQRQQLVAQAPDETSAIRPWKNGRDLSQGSRGHFVIDLFPRAEDAARARYPRLYQHLLNHVKPHRDQVSRRGHRERWWIWGEARPGLRAATSGLARIIVTNFAAKHRYFVFESPATALDHNMYLIGDDDSLVLGILSSQLHVQWMLRAGGTLEDRPTWTSSTCFLPFPFPHEDTGLTPAINTRIRDLAEQLDAHRKARQAAHRAVTLTGLYNVLDKLRRNEPLNAKDKLLHEQGLVSVLQSLHDALDAAVLQAYGWADLGAVPWADDTARSAWTEAVLLRLVALNAKRAAEEAAGTVRWLRPDFQDPARRAAAADAAASVPQQTGIEGVETPAEAAARAAVADDAAEDAEDAEDAAASGEGADPPVKPAAVTAAAGAAVAVQPWPATLPEQVRGVAQLLAASPAPLPLPAIEAGFKGKGPWKKGLPLILQTLEAVGRARQVAGGWRG